MQNHAGITGRVSLRFLLFFLMTAVFAFGLHARVQLLRVGTPTTASKIAKENHSSAKLVAETVSDEPSTAVEDFFVLQVRATDDRTQLDTLHPHQVEVGLWRPARAGAAGVSSMLRPPPKRS